MKQIDRLTIIGVFLVIAIIGVLVYKGGQSLEIYETGKDYSEVMTEIQEGLIKRGYEIEKIQPIDKGLAKSGYEIEKYRVIFFNPKSDIRWIRKNHPKFTVFFPLTITIAKQKGKIKIINTPFRLLLKNANNDELKRIIRKWEKESHEIIANAIKRDVPVKQTDNLEYSTLAYSIR
jgi:uncharacterized protein (DUF302 family)